MFSILKSAAKVVVDFFWGEDTPTERETAIATEDNVKEVGEVEIVAVEEKEESQAKSSQKTSAESGAKIVCDGATCSCSQGTLENIPLVITSNKKVYINNSQLAATIKDATFQATFGNCKLNNNYPCCYVPNQSQWEIKAGNIHPTVNGAKILTENGTLECKAKTGGIVKIHTHGQQVNISSKDVKEVDSSVLYIINSAVCSPEDIEGKIKGVDSLSASYQKNNKSTPLLVEKTEQEIKHYNVRCNTNYQIEASVGKNHIGVANWLIGGDEAAWKKDSRRDAIKDATILMAGPLILNVNFKKEETCYIEGFGGELTSSIDKKCAVGLVAYKENKITDIIIPSVIIQNQTSPVSIKTRFPLNEEEHISFSILQNDTYIKDISAGVSDFKINGLSAGRYTIQASFVGKTNSKFEKEIGVVSNLVNKILLVSPFKAPKATLGQIVSLKADLKDNSQVPTDGKHVKWYITDPAKTKTTSQGLTCEVPLPLEGEYIIKAKFSKELEIKNDMIAEYKIEAIKNKIQEWEYDIGIEKKEDSDIETILPYADKEYQIEAKLTNPIHTLNVVKDVDNSVVWKLTNEKGKDVSKESIKINNPIEEQKIEDKNDTSLIFKKSFTVKYGGTKIKLNIPIKGTYKLSSTCRGNTYERMLIVEDSKITRWKFTDSNEQYRRNIGWKQSFGIVIQAQGWESQKGEIKFYLDLAKNSDSRRHKLLISKEVEFDKNGKLMFAVRPVGDKEDKVWSDWTNGDVKSDELWEQLSKYEYNNKAQIYFTIKGLPKCVNQNTNVYTDSLRKKEVFPHDESRVYAYLYPNSIISGYFALQDGNDFLKRVIKYDEKPKIVIHHSRGKDNKNDAEDKKEYKCVLYENREGKDEKVKINKKADIMGADFKFSAEGKFEVDIDATEDQWGKHIEYEKLIHKPRLFYFAIFEGSSSEKTPTKDKYYNLKPTYIFPEGFDPSDKNDDFILEVKDDKSVKMEESSLFGHDKEKAKQLNVGYFYQLKVASDLTGNKSLGEQVFATIGEQLEREEYEERGSGQCPECKELHIDLRTEFTFKEQSESANCFDACKNIIKKLGLTTTGPYDPETYNVVKEDSNHKKFIFNEGQNKKAIVYLNNSLEQGTPVIIGVDHTKNYTIYSTRQEKQIHPNSDLTTDHYVLIVGRHCEQGEIYYQYWDVATQHGSNENLRFKFNERGFLISDATWKEGRTYTVTQIRTSK